MNQLNDFVKFKELSGIDFPVFKKTDKIKLIVGLKKHWMMLEKFCRENEGYQYLIIFS